MCTGADNNALCFGTVDLFSAMTAGTKTNAPTDVTGSGCSSDNGPLWVSIPTVATTETVFARFF